MIRTIIEKSLRELLKGVNDDVNPIFDVVNKVETLKVETKVDEVEKTESTKERSFTRTVKTLELNSRGIKFVNSIVDHAEADKSDELTMLNGYKVCDYCYPNIGLTKLVNLSRKAYFNRDKFDAQVGQLLKYPQITECDFHYNENGDIETLDPETFTSTWNLIMKQVKVTTGISCSTKLTKPILYWENLNIAMKGGKLMKKIATTPSRDEQILAQLCAAEWNIDADQFLIGGIEALCDEAMMDWLTGKSEVSVSEKKLNNSNYNPRKNKFQNKNNAKKQNPNGDVGYQKEQSRDDKATH